MHPAFRFSVSDDEDDGLSTELRGKSDFRSIRQATGNGRQTKRGCERHLWTPNKEQMMNAVELEQHVFEGVDRQMASTLAEVAQRAREAKKPIALAVAAAVPSEAQRAVAEVKADGKAAIKTLASASLQVKGHRSVASSNSFDVDDDAAQLQTDIGDEKSARKDEKGLKMLEDTSVPLPPLPPGWDESRQRLVLEESNNVSCSTLVAHPGCGRSRSRNSASPLSRRLKRSYPGLAACW